MKLSAHSYKRIKMLFCGMVSMIAIATFKGYIKQNEETDYIIEHDQVHFRMLQTTAGTIDFGINTSGGLTSTGSTTDSTT